MSVYAVVQLEFVDREIYDRYTANFWDVFKQFNGTLLVNDENPEVLEGHWTLNKLVVLKFPSRDDFMRWAGSADYQEIAKDRRAGANATITLSEGVDLHARDSS